MRSGAAEQVGGGSVRGMSEPMPDAVPAQQDGEAAEAAGSAEPAAPTYPEPLEPADHPEVPTPENAPGSAPEYAGPEEHAATAATAATAETAESAESAESAEQAVAEEDDGPRPLGLHVEPTGHAPVDAQLRRLDDADHLAVSGHLEVYEDVHRGLREALSGLDRHNHGPGPAPGSAPVPGGPSAHGHGRPVPGPAYPRS